MGKPKIRFKGYADDWEQRKLSEVAKKTYGGGTPRTSEEAFWNGRIPWLQSADLIEHEVLSAMPKKGITDAGLQNSAAQLIPKNSIAIVTRVGVGKLAFMPFEYATSQDFLSLCNLNIDGKFGCYVLYRLLQKEKNLTQGTSIKGITKEELLNKELLVPKQQEQVQIGKYFSTLDHLITLHQRKCDETKKLKKYMLQKMFPQNGEKVPKIRFAGFSDDWEQRKFSELYVRSSEKNDGSIGMDKNITVATMQFKEDVQVSTAEYLKTYYTFNLGDIAFEGHQSKEFRYGRFVENDIGNGIVSHIFAVFRPIQEYDLYFWKYAINNETLMQRILGRSTKASTMMHDLVANDFLNETFLVPSIDEQKQIGSLFNKLDHLITLHQQKCDELQNIKKFMLKNMFNRKNV